MSDNDKPSSPKRIKSAISESYRGLKCVKCNIGRRKIRTSDVKIISNENKRSKYSKLLKKCVLIGDFMCLKCDTNIKLQEIPKPNPKKQSLPTNQIPSSSSKNDIETINYTDKNTAAYKLIQQLSGLTTEASS